ncbi:MAG: FMN-binding glutamate synthase family protein [Desulfobacterales bacterium]|nr:MAG: FMN-binding glutamate synthase family protein [Desulfobacterales bacterium]
MTYSPLLNSVFNRTKLRDPEHVSYSSGMCSLCAENCIGSCEIGLAAVRGADTVYPTTTGANQIASEKRYPIDYSHFNINGRAFGAVGAPNDPNVTTIADINLETEIGTINPVKLKLPIVLPALIKLNWQDYFGGAAMAGVLTVIGEGAVDKDPELKIENGKVVHFPKLSVFLDAFRNYYRGYGQIILQVNIDDNRLQVPEYAIRECGCEAIEFKFGQSAKGTQPVNKLATLEDAVKASEMGYIVKPDPSDPTVRERYKAGFEETFRLYSRLLMWDETCLKKRIRELREMGLKNVYFKMAGFDPVDLEHILRLASETQVDMVTFDGAGGGSGYSPCKMMNEWCLPTCVLQSALNEIMERLKKEGRTLPHISITGGLSSEDHVFKVLALGAPYISTVGLCRASMAATMSAKKVSELLERGNLPGELKRFGSTKDELFPELRKLRDIYGKEANDFSPGAIGVFSYLNKIAFGIRHFAALNRKFDLKFIDQNDIFPLTRDAQDIMDGKWMK